MPEEKLGDRLLKLVNRATAVFPEDQRGDLIVQIVSLVHSRDPDGFPARLAEKVIELPGQHKAGVEMVHLAQGEAAEALGQDIAAGLGQAGLSLAFIVAKQDTINLLFPNLAGQNKGFTSL